ncbi:SDR family oxidoreductase [Mycolicibacterium poriferae]|uniref:SDR family oxidoreductase n=1 Tax=Mycolicibacterium poriferae TaxID=39694 RepID=UPI0024B96F47|nr:SDR family oxidoreductase [Mycolicibacterium poriferae]
MAISSEKKLPSQENLLLEYMRRLEKHKEDRKVVHLHLSLLRPMNRREQHIRTATGNFENIVKSMDGHVFTVKNSDIFVMYKKTIHPHVETAVQQIRYLFDDDPLIVEEEHSDKKFASWYDAEQDFDSVVAVHLKGTFNLTRHAAAWWRENRGGQYRLINFTSMSGLQGAPSQPNYAAAKMGIVGLTFSCANALKGYGVRCNAIAPIAGTRMTQGIKGGGSMDYSPENKRLAPENVVPPVVYLASEQSEWLNRRVIFAGNGRISLMSNPVVEREIVSSSGTWDIPTAFTEIETSFKEAVLYPNIFDKPPAG